MYRHMQALRQPCRHIFKNHHLPPTFLPLVNSQQEMMSSCRSKKNVHELPLYNMMVLALAGSWALHQVESNDACWMESRSSRVNVVGQHPVSAKYELQGSGSGSSSSLADASRSFSNPPAPPPAAALLGQGGFGQVMLARHKKTQTSVALKQMSKSRVSKSRFRQEVDILRQVGGKHNVIEFRDAFESQEHWVIVTEVARGGELFDVLIEHGTYGQVPAAELFIEACIALHYVHAQGLVHADIKPENIVLHVPEDNPENLKSEQSKHVTKMRLIDFGQAFRLKDRVESRPYFAQRSGTVAYSAPELLLGQHKLVNGQVDVFSLGIVLFIILAGYHPFDAHNSCSDDEIKDRIVAGKPDFEHHRAVWKRMSPTVQDLLSRMLCVNPKDRITLDQVFEHPWILEMVPSFRCPPLHHHHELHQDNNNNSDNDDVSTAAEARLGEHLMELLQHIPEDNIEKQTRSLEEGQGQEEETLIDKALSVLDPLEKGFIGMEDMKQAIRKWVGHELSDQDLHEMLLACDHLENEHQFQYFDIARILHQYSASM